MGVSMNKCSSCLSSFCLCGMRHTTHECFCVCVCVHRVSEVELRLAKQQMERDFLAKQLKPGDPAYEYDKQVCFLLCSGSVCTTHTFAQRHFNVHLRDQ